MTRAKRVEAASRHRRDVQRLGLRQTILDAAAKLFLEEGYAQFSMRQIAEGIGYSATTIYRYFSDKDDLLFAVVDRGFHEFEQALTTAAASSHDPTERLRALGRAYIDFGRANPAYYQLMFMQRGDYLCSPPAGAEKPRVAAFSALEQAVEAALAAGAITPGDPRAYSHLLWAVVHGAVSLAIAMPDLKILTTDRERDLIVDVALKGLRP